MKPDGRWALTFCSRHKVPRFVYLGNKYQAHQAQIYLTEHVYSAHKVTSVVLNAAQRHPWMKELAVHCTVWVGSVELRGTEYEELGTSPLLACAPGECTQQPCPWRTVPHGTSANPRDRAKAGMWPKGAGGPATESDACWIRLRQFDQGPATGGCWPLPPLRRETDGSAKEIMQGGEPASKNAEMCRVVCVCMCWCVFGGWQK